MAPPCTANSVGGSYNVTASVNGLANPAVFSLTNIQTNVNVTLDTSPPNLMVSVDGGASMAAPLVTALAPNSMHTIATQSPQSGPAGTQYQWQSWSDPGAISHMITVPGVDTTDTATFKTQYQLTISASPPAGGSVTPSSGGFYDAGSVVNLSATANSGYQFSSWSGPVDSPNSAATTVTMSAPKTVAANFSAATAITIQTAPPGLQFSVDGGPAQAAPRTLSLLPGPHTLAVANTQAGDVGTQYAFTGWNDGGAASHPVNVGATAATYTATFKTQCQLTMAASPAAGGSVVPPSGAFYDAGAVVNVTATPASGYQFNIWSGPVAEANSASTSVTMSAAETITANFASLTGITIQTSPTGLQFAVDGGPLLAAPQTLNLSSGSHTIAVAATQPGAAGTQYVFTGWSDGGGVSHSIIVATSPDAYTASFKTQYQLTTSAAPAAGGTVTPASGGFYDAGAAVNVTATAISGYQFSSWSGPVVAANSAATSVTMSAPEAITANFQAVTAGLLFVPVTPCRVLDTRNAVGPFGGPAIPGGNSRDFAMPSSACNIPANARAYSLNVTVVPPGPLTYLTIWPTGQPQPLVSTLNSFDGRVVANAAIVPVGSGASGPGSISIFVSDTTDVIVDINGYFAPLGGPGALAFYPANPCRAVDTRPGQGTGGQCGPPSLIGNAARSFGMQQSACAIPSAAQAYALNVTVVPAGPLGYLTAWPAGQPQPLVSTLNSFQGKVVANAAIVPAGQGGAISVFVTNTTDVIVDVNGYFAQ